MKATTPQDPAAAGVDAYTASWVDEYRYRRLFPMTHHAYLAEPVHAVRWMLEIHQLIEQIKAEKQRGSAGG